MTEIYIARHGQTEWNREGIIQGCMDSKLTDIGIIGAELLNKRVKDLEIDYIISSPLGRAYNTAKIIKGDRDIEIIKCDGLKEICCGDFEGHRFMDLSEEYPEEFSKIRENPFDNRYPNGENLSEFFDRVAKCFKDIIEKYKNNKILIVAHGGTIKCIQAFIRNRKIDNKWFDSVVENCSFTHLKIIDGDIKVCVFNDITHLEEASFA